MKICVSGPHNEKGYIQLPDQHNPKYPYVTVAKDLEAQGWIIRIDFGHNFCATMDKEYFRILIKAISNHIDEHFDEVEAIITADQEIPHEV